MNNSKTYFLALQFLFIVSCNVFEEPTQQLLVKGTIIDSYTEEPVSDIEIKYEICEPIGEVMFNTCVTTSEGRINTDSHGKFSVMINYENSDDLFKLFTLSKNDDYFIGSSQHRYSISSLEENSQIKLKSFRKAKVKLIVKNTNPYDSNDKIEIEYFRIENSIGSQTLERDEVINYGNTNTIYDNGNTIIDLLEWKGENINSVVKGKLRAYNKTFVTYRVKKNGSFYSERTESKILGPNAENEFLIEY